MKEIPLSAKTGSCRILIGESVSNLHKYCPAGAIIVVDRAVAKLHSKKFAKFRVIEVDCSEKSKNLATVERLYSEFLAAGVDRSSFIVGVGGGVLTDVAGFAASTYLRSLRFGFVPTTLLAMTDASIGGKNGVNFMGYKNLIGTIRQPEFCLIDLDFLPTLPEKELRCGFAEIIKHGVIKDAGLFAFLEKNREKALKLDTQILEKILYDSIKVKADVVGSDELEAGERAKLNFGHTIGHAIENLLGIAHGEAVSIGMSLEARHSFSTGRLGKGDFERIVALLKDFGLPVSAKFDPEKAFEAISVDKKVLGESINFPFVDSIGNCHVEKIGLEELRMCIHDLR